MARRKKVTENSIETPIADTGSAAQSEQPTGEHEVPASSPRGKLVVVGSSAGGVQALSILVNTLPTDFPAPIVLAQHLDPTRPSNLTSILERRSTLPVVTVHEHAHMEPGVVYVVPSNRHVTISDGYVEPEGDHANRPRPSVDLLLTTAARNYGENLIAVILTGSGSDGAAGAIDVKNAGGTVVIQNPLTALYPSMPMALPPTAVDYVVDVEEIGPLLAEIVKELYMPMFGSTYEDPLREILDLVTKQANLDFRHYKPTTILRRIARRMSVTHNQNIREYLEFIKKQPSEIGELVMAFLIIVTEFFRDSAAFEFLKAEIIPDLILRGRNQGKTLRLWSAGCATGEEAYSLALLLADALGDELSSWNIKLFATDVDENAIAFARRGLYPANVLGAMPIEYRDRYFEPFDEEYRVSKSLRQIVIFGQQDLSRGIPFPRIDLVTCRNLLIYFKPERQQQILEMFAFSLQATHGYLFLGHAETIRPAQVNFQLINKKWKVYRCIGTVVPKAAYGKVSTGKVKGTQQVALNASDKSPTEIVQSKSTHLDLTPDDLRYYNDVVLRHLPDGLVIIDRSYTILTANTSARRVLGIHDLRNDQDFLHSVRGLPYLQVRNAIDTVFRERSATTVRDIKLDEVSGGNGRCLNFTIVPVDSGSRSAQLVAISMQDVTEQVEIRNALEAVQQEQKNLLVELQVTNRRLSEINKDLQDANEELQASNEELMLAQEELQATNEEFEATNEELQATNEELETTNEELQATNEELETTNEELSARTGELQELTGRLEAERLQLSELVEYSQFYVMVLRGPQLVVAAYNSLHSRIFQDRSLVGLPAMPLFEDVGLSAVLVAAEAVYWQNKQQTLRAKVQIHDNLSGPHEATLLYTIYPLHGANGIVEGVVLNAEDVSELLAGEDLERREKLKLMVEHADQVALALFDATTTELVQASPRYLEVLRTVHGNKQRQMLGRPFRELVFGYSSEDAETLFKEVVEARVSRRLPEIKETADTDVTNNHVWDMTLSPITLSGGEEWNDKSSGGHRVRFVALSAIEVTEQARAREELERLDNLKGVFLSSASHDLNTPLTVIAGYSDLLTRIIPQNEGQTRIDPRVGEYIEKIRKQIRHMKRLTDDLLDVARVESGKLSLQLDTVDIAEILRDAVESAQISSAGPDVQLHTASKASEAVAVLGDQIRLTQAISNLLHNAIKYAPNSKKVDVRLRVDKRAGVVEIKVQDYGFGISSEELPNIFDRYFQATNVGQEKRNGLGLGLYITRSIIEQHGGTISVESDLGEGSVFTVTLPLLRD